MISFRGDILDLVCIWRSDKNGKLTEGAGDTNECAYIHPVDLGINTHNLFWEASFHAPEKAILQDFQSSLRS